MKLSSSDHEANPPQRTRARRERTGRATPDVRGANARALGLMALGLALLAWAGAPAAASAQAAETAEVAEARTRFEAGRLAFEAGRFEEALEDFRRSYGLSGRSQLLYNIALCLDRLDRGEEALSEYERYLREQPDATNRGAVERRSRILRNRSTGDASAPAEAVVDLRVSGETSGPSPAGIALLVAGGVLAAGGAASLGVGVADRATVEGAMDGARWDALAEAADRAPILETVGALGLGLGVALLAVGVSILALEGGDESPRASLSISPTGLSVRGAF